MDLVEGSTLQQIIKESGPIPLETAIPIFIQVCDALAHAHGKGIVHRDLKPSNIMVVENESSNTNVRIVDFGIAKVTASSASLCQP
jgi:serine/threonine-protein kinase